LRGINLKLVSKYVEETLFITPQYQVNILKSLLIVLVLIIIRFVIVRIADKRFKNQQTFYRFQKSTNYIFWLFLLILVGRIWFHGIQSLATFFGLVSAGIAIALKDPLVNLAGWMFIFWVKPFDVGERIEVGDVKGDVIDVGAFQISLLEIGKGANAEVHTGRIINVPNSVVFTKSLANYDKSFPFIWDHLKTQVTFESDWKIAKEIFEKIGEKFSKKYSEQEINHFKRASKHLFFSFKDFSPVVNTTIKDCGIEISLKYMVEPRIKRKMRTAIWEEVLTEFAGNPSIDFAYPTQRFYNNLTEGKVKASA